MKDFNDIHAFVAVIRAGSFSRAAVQTGIPKSTLSRKLQLLEERLGVQLVRRTTRSLQLTRAGEEYFQNAARIFSELDEIEKVATSSQQEPKGVIRFTAPLEVGTSIFPALLAKFSEKYPQVCFDLVLTDRFVDLWAENFDLALRASQSALKDSSLKSVKVASSSFHFYASAEYLKKQGAPRTPGDIAKHRFLLFTPGEKDPNWVIVNTANTQRGKLKFGEVSRINSLLMVREMVEAGMGIALLPRFLAESSLQSGSMLRILPGWQTPVNPFYLVFPPQKFMPPRLRVFIEFLREEMTKVLW